MKVERKGKENPLRLPFPTASGSCSLLFQVRVEPREDGVIPEFGVLRLENPVAFVGEVEELGRERWAVLMNEDETRFGGFIGCVC